MVKTAYPMDTNKLERVKQLVMKQLTGTLTGPE